MKVWITRDKKDNSSGARGDVAIWAEYDKPDCGDPDWIGDGHYFDAKAKDVKAVLGFTPRKGSCKQYELTLKEII